MHSATLFNPDIPPISVMLADPVNFFRNSGVWIDADFAALVKRTQVADWGTSAQVGVRKYPSPLKLGELKTILQESDLFDELTVCAVVAGILESKSASLAQQRGSNLFCTKRYVIQVQGILGDQLVGLWPRDHKFFDQIQLPDAYLFLPAG
ncbi:MAG: hypothetical protein V4436_03620 [Patescibacteria group bacterium]